MKYFVSRWSVYHPLCLEGHKFVDCRVLELKCCRKVSWPGQRKPNTPTQVNDVPRAFSKGHMGFQQKQKMATTQQAR